MAKGLADRDRSGLDLDAAAPKVAPLDSNECEAWLNAKAWNILFLEARRRVDKARRPQCHTTQRTFEELDCS